LYLRGCIPGEALGGIRRQSSQRRKRKTHQEQLEDDRAPSASCRGGEVGHSRFACCDCVGGDDPKGFRHSSLTSTFLISSRLARTTSAIACPFSISETMLTARYPLLVFKASPIAVRSDFFALDMAVL